MTAIALGRPATAGVTDRLRAAIAAGLVAMSVAFTNVGASIVTNRMIQAGTAPKNLGWGTGTTAAAVTDTTLTTEAAPTTGGGRIVGAESRVQTTNPNDTYQVVGTIVSPTAQAISEGGLFDAVSAGNMLLHAVFAAMNLNANDSITFTYGLKFVPSIT